MIYCPVCKGSGKRLNGVEAGGVRKICGGFGFFKRHKNVQKKEFEYNLQNSIERGR